MKKKEYMWRFMFLKDKDLYEFVEYEYDVEEARLSALSKLLEMDFDVEQKLVKIYHELNYEPGYTVRILFTPEKR